MITKPTEAEIAAARLADNIAKMEARHAYDAASPEERAAFEKDWPAHHTAQRFMRWREDKRMAASASPEERKAFEAHLREQFDKLCKTGDHFAGWLRRQEHARRAAFLNSRGFSGGVEWPFGNCEGDAGELAGLPDHLWNQVKAAVEAGHIKPEPDKSQSSAS